MPHHLQHEQAAVSSFLMTRESLDWICERGIVGTHQLATHGGNETCSRRKGLRRTDSGADAYFALRASDISKVSPSLASKKPGLSLSRL